MEKITIESQQAINDDIWQFKVVVGEGSNSTRHTVELSHEYWITLTEGKTEPAELVRESFRFLLTKEPKTSILSQFNLHEITRFFPEYEGAMREGL